MCKFNSKASSLQLALISKPRKITRNKEEGGKNCRTMIEPNCKQRKQTMNLNKKCLESKNKLPPKEEEEEEAITCIELEQSTK